MSDGSPFPRILALGFALIVALSCVAAAAQSGRRSKSPPPPATSPTPESPEPAATPDLPKPTLRFIIGIERYDSFSSVSLNAYSGVLPSCASRLDESPAITVTPLERPLSRAEAANRAKGEKIGYVVWLNVRENNLSSGRTGTPNNAYIEYVVFAPITAKVVTSGSSYPRTKSINPGRTIGVNGDPEFNEAARNAANKIYAAMSAHIPPHIF
jgi:hypothetical protein